MFKAISMALVPLIVAVAGQLGKPVDPEQVAAYMEALNYVVAATGVVVAALFPSIKAALKFGKEAK